MDALVNGTRKASGKKITQAIWDGIKYRKDVEDMSDEEIQEQGWTPKEIAMITKLKHATSFVGYDFGGVDFDEVDFGAPYDFSRSKMRGVVMDWDFSKPPKFDGVDFTGSSISIGVPPGSSFVGAKFVAADFSRHSKFSGCDLTRSDFTSADASGVDFSRANLSGSDFTDATFIDANLTGATLTGIKYNAKTKWPKGFTPPKSAK
jgi:uncharacterized protein YjbI with pentapeptide repeats